MFPLSLVNFFPTAVIIARSYNCVDKKYPRKTILEIGKMHGQGISILPRYFGNNYFSNILIEKV
ncbi:MAG: hypothetical protein BA862_09790 [Desulfobulbaceae bacterium S3730MH12]|nr:MAG: hypothetical protein BA866_06365 [Desulfobulbaceae bacterium S5133MH15]OEU54341.1 MAG: hypothetical protein BA862_09790 [Desulfobulbaceae bacterium S3730MH12]OEU83575.1 MAG: hypothetical protein BA873_10635 [Desulfobulbaceae bacterium C00003063]